MLWKKSPYGGGGAIFGGGGKVNVESWRCVQTLRSHSGDVLDLAWSPNDALLATASVDNTVIVWNAEKLPEIVATLRGHTGLVKGVVFDPVGKFLATQSDDKSLRVWRISDWREEAVVKAPFEECGATTHVLRPGIRPTYQCNVCPHGFYLLSSIVGWSPDGSMLVSAHAMNGGGPTAQIIDRDTWKTTRDFVGHKKAVSCVRFNKNILHKKDNASEVFVSVAMGSRDRSFSIWSTNLKRPLVVVSDVFDQSVLDLSWSKDGKILLACSMDGSVAAAILGPSENGMPLSETKTYDLLSKSYGKSFGIPQVKAKKTNGTVIVENPELLKAQQQLQKDAKTNGTVAGEKPKQQQRGPTKQIEARTSDGRRRITPIFIPPDAEESMGANRDEFGSSSTQEKSKIEVEKRDGIVQPNVSPGKGKKGEEGKDQSEDDADKSKGSKTNGEPPVNVIKVKKKPGAESGTNKSEPEAKTIAIKRKKPNTSSDKENGGGGSSSGGNEGSSSPPKLSSARKNRIISDSSDSDSSSSSDDGSSDDSSDDDDEGEEKKDLPNGTASSSSSQKEDKLGKKKDDVSRPELFSGAGKKRKLPPTSSGTASSAAEEAAERPRKRGRPPGSGMRDRMEAVDAARAPSIPTATAVTSPTSAPAPRQHDSDHHRPSASAGPSSSALAAASPSFQCYLPTLTMERGKTQGFTFGSEKVVVAVHNNYKSFGSGSGSQSVHLLKCQCSEGKNWLTLLPGAVGAVVASTQYLLVACKDATLNVFTPAGARKFPPIMLPAALSKIDVRGDTIAAVTDTARFFLWEMRDSGLRAILRNECLLSLLQSDCRGNEEVTISKLNFSSVNRQPVVVTSAGKAFTYSEEVGAWLKMTDHSNPVMAISSYAGASSNKSGRDGVSDARSHPLAALSKQAPSLAPLQDVPANFRTMANLAHCEAQRASAEYLRSGPEYKYWLLATVRHLTKAGSADKLRDVLNSLLKNPTEGDLDGANSHILGQDKKGLLKEALMIVAENVELQRLFVEYKDLTETNEKDLMDVQSVLD